MRQVLGIVVWSLLVAPATVAQIDAFDWTLAGNTTGSGGVTPGNLHVVGPNWGSCDPHVTWFETVMPVGGTLSVLVDFQNLDSYYYKGQAWYDGPAWVIDGVYQLPPQTGSYPSTPEGWLTGPYEFEFEVEVGQHVGFGVWSLDCDFGPGVADFHDLVVVPAAWTLKSAALDPRDLWSDVFDVVSPVVAAAGDVDADGVADLAIAVQTDSMWSASLLSGADGALLLNTAPTASQPMALAGPGDLDGDGHDDIAVGIPSAEGTAGASTGRIDVYSGADGTLLHQFQGGAAFDQMGDRLDGAGDVNLDGVPDLVTRLVKVLGSPAEIRILSGTDGKSLQSVVPPIFTKLFGLGLAGAGDLTSDGVPDVLIGSPSTSLGVMLVSGANGAQVKTYSDPPGTSAFGTSVATAGDATGDGVADVVVGAPGNAGAVVVFSGTDAAVVLYLAGIDPDGHLGQAVDGGSDVDGDGRLDVVAGAPDEGQGGIVHVFDALDGTSKAAFDIAPSSAAFGTSVTMPGDLDGDGRGDVVTLWTALLTEALPAVRAFSHFELTGPPVLAATGSLLPGELVSIDITQAPPGVPGYLVLGLSLVSAPFADGVLVPSPDAILLVIPDSSGAVQLSGRWPAGLATWTTIWMQAWFPVEPGSSNFGASDAVGATQL